MTETRRLTMRMNGMSGAGAAPAAGLCPAAGLAYLACLLWIGDFGAF